MLGQFTLGIKRKDFTASGIKYILSLILNSMLD